MGLWGSRVWGACVANVVYMRFALMCVHVAWFEPPKAAKSRVSACVTDLLKKRKWEMSFYGDRATEWRIILHAKI